MQISPELGKQVCELKSQNEVKKRAGVNRNDN